MAYIVGHLTLMTLLIQSIGEITLSTKRLNHRANSFSNLQVLIQSLFDKALAANIVLYKDFRILPGTFLVLYPFNS